MSIMDEWRAIFQGVQGLTRSATSFGEGLGQTISFARKNPEMFDEPGYWDQAEQHSFSRSASKVIAWAREGLENDDAEGDWGLLILDLGDCPDVFALSSPGGQALLDEGKVHGLLRSENLIGAEDIEECFASSVRDAYQTLYGGCTYPTRHTIAELSDNLLNWHASRPMDFHGYNGCLLWLAFGSLALLEPLREVGYCRRILRGRGRLYLLSGFESIFFHLATVTPDGLRFEGSVENSAEDPSDDQPRLPFESGDP